MTPETAKALELSIEHWKRMKQRRKVGKEEPTGEHCALCALFNAEDQTSNNCEGCPVKAVSGSPQCFGTPFGDARRAFYNVNEEAWQEAAQREIEFLESLREPKHHDT